MGRFELPTSPTRKERSTKLSHIPTKPTEYSIPARNRQDRHFRPSLNRCKIIVGSAHAKCDSVRKSQYLEYERTHRKRLTASNSLFKTVE